jgi:hypothetical protein
MKYYSPVYELLYQCEQKGMYLKGWDLMNEADILDTCLSFLQAKGVMSFGPGNYNSTAESN